MKKTILFIVILTQTLCFAQDLENTETGTIGFSASMLGWAAQPFTTGPDFRMGITYTIEFDGVGDFLEGFVVDLYDSNNDLPRNLVTNLSGESDFRTRPNLVKTYTSNDVLLQPNTKYHIVMHSTNDRFLPLANNVTPVTSQNGFSSGRIVTSSDGGQKWSEISTLTNASNFVFSITTMVNQPDVTVSNGFGIFAEGADILFTIGLSSKASEAVTVTLTPFANTAQSTDFVTNSVTVTFNSGETSKVIAIPTIDDDIPEITETIILKITDSTGPLSDISDEGTGRIAESDLLPTVISNIEKVKEDKSTINDVGISLGFSQSQPFTTGNSQVTTLSFTIGFGDFDERFSGLISSGFVVELYDDNAGIPGNLISSFDGRSNFDDDVFLNGFSDFNLLIYNLQNLNLNPNTKYHIVLSTTQDEFDILQTLDTNSVLENGFTLAPSLGSSETGVWEELNRNMVFSLGVIEDNTLSTDTISTGSQSINTVFENGLFTVKNEEVTHISVYNLTGEKVIDAEENIISFKTLSRGIYIILININGVNTLKKVLY